MTHGLLRREPPVPDRRRAVGLLSLPLLLMPAAAMAQAPTDSAFGEVYEASFKAIFLLFVLAVLLESALALLFNWKPFVENLVPRAVRPLIAFVVAFLFVRYFDLDIVTALVNAVTGKAYAASTPGMVLTAMIIAGGSAGVNSMLVALGFRQVRTPATAGPPKPPAGKAYISVRALKGEAVGDLYVYAGPPPAAGAPAGTRPLLLGVIKGRSVRNFFSWFVPDSGRLPRYGGHTVDPGRDYVIVVEGRKEDGTVVQWQVGPLQFADGAFVDLDVTV